VLSYRDEELELAAGLRELLAALRREQLAGDIALDSLDANALGELVERHFAPDPVAPGLLAEIAGRAEGNPFFAGELARAFVEEGWARRRDGVWELERRGAAALPVPSAVVELLELRIQHLGDAAQEVV